MTTYARCLDPDYWPVVACLLVIVVGQFVAIIILASRRP